MKISFQKTAPDLGPELLFCWRLEIDVPMPAEIDDLFIPELYFDYFYIKRGGIACREPLSGDAITLWPQTLKTLYTDPLTLSLKVPLLVYGARFALPFADLHREQALPARRFLPQAWIAEPVTDLPRFAVQVTDAIRTRRTAARRAPLVDPFLNETATFATYSARHKRRLYKSRFGLSRKEMEAIDKIHGFLGQTCSFAGQRPRLVEHVDSDLFYDQPHLNNAFRKITGLSPLAYFEANSIVQDNLMAASYNERAAE